MTLNVGDRVRGKWNGMYGVITAVISDLTVKVHLDGIANPVVNSAADLILVEPAKPAPKFKVGDKVIYGEETASVVFAHVDRDGDEMYAVLMNGYLYVLGEDDMEKAKTVKYAIMRGTDLSETQFDDYDSMVKFRDGLASTHWASGGWHKAPVVKLEY